MRLNPDLDRVLRFKPHLAVARLDGAAFLIGERERFVLSGSSALVLAELLDGRRSVRDLLRATDGAVPSAALLEGLSELEARGFVEEARPALEPAADVFLSAAGLERALRPRVALAVAPRLVELRAPLVAALEGAGLELVEDAELRVIVADDYLAEDTRRELAAARAAGADSFLVKPTGVIGFVGPLLAADHGPCWACLCHALERQRPVERLLARHGANAGAPAAALHASVLAIGGLAAVRLRALVDPGSPLARSARRELVSVDFASLRGEAHLVRKRPQCAVCGDATRMARVGEARIELAARPRRFAEGGYRERSAAETYERLRPLVSRVLGPVTHLEPMPRRNAPGRAVFASGYFVCPAGGVPRSNAFDRLCAGKGRSVEQARASALGEAVERFAGVYQGDEAARRGSFEELAPDAISPDALQRFSDAQLARGETPPDTPPGLRVPRRFDPRAVFDWTPAWSLTEDRRRYVPLAFCYSPAPESAGAPFCAPSSNGSAAGHSLEEAILQGALELVERDAAAIWWYDRLRRPAIALSELRDPWVEALVADYRALGFDVWALDLTHDLGIPVVAAVACHAESQRFVLGFGCHLELELAAERALSELNQIFDPEALTPTPWDGLSAAREVHVNPVSDAPARAPSDARATGSGDLRADVALVIERLRRADLELLVVNKSRPDVELAVAQVIVPGLCHVWPRFAPGRLYDVPPRLGLAERALTEDELNPRPLLI